MNLHMNSKCDTLNSWIEFMDMNSCTSLFVRSFVLTLTRNNGTEPWAPNRGQALQHAAQARARVAEDTSHAPVLRTGRKHLAIISAGEGEGS